MTRATVWAAAALMVLSACARSAPVRRAAAPATPSPPPQPIAAAPHHPSVIAVGASGGAPGELSTGFFVRPDLVATTRHGVEGRSRLSLRLPEGKRVAARGPLAESREHDLALLEIAIESAGPALELSERTPRAGDRLRVVWAKNSRTQRTDAAVVIREEVVVRPWGTVFQLRAPLALGCSGAPVLDARGHVVGVVVAGDPEHGVFYAVPARFVRSLSAGVAPKPPALAPVAPR